MPFYSYIIVALLALAGAAPAALWRAQAASTASAQEVSGASVQFMGHIVRNFMKANPTKTGEISASDLAPYIPSWFNGDSRIQVAGQDGRGYIFIVANSGERAPAEAVLQGDEMPVTLGLAMNGQLISPTAGTILLSIPSLIPNGSLVYVV